MKNGRCRMHGGASTGPRTQAGLQRLRDAHTIHGFHVKHVPDAFDLHVAHILERGRLISPFADGSSDIDFAYWIVYPKWRTPSKLARTFMAWLKSEAQAGEVIGV